MMKNEEDKEKEKLKKSVQGLGSRVLDEDGQLFLETEKYETMIRVRI